MDIFSNLQVACECLLDEARTRAFIRAIEAVVTPGCAVVESGTGTGILSLVAARSGAGRVLAVEIAPDLVELAARNFAANGFGPDGSTTIELLSGDVRDVRIEMPVDVVIMEMLDTGMVAEQQCAAINALHGLGIVSESTLFVPAEMTSYLQLVDYDFEFYGFSMPCIVQARNDAATKRVRALRSRLTPYDSVRFDRTVPDRVDTEVSCGIESSGRANALVLSSRIRLAGTEKLWGTTDMNMPVVLPIEPYDAREGTSCRIGIRYVRGSGFDKVEIAVA